jgi:hypothetical protein
LIWGLLQGDPLSPLLFNIFINDIEEFFKCRGFHGVKISDNKDILILAYADDLVIFSKSPVDLRDKLETLEDYCRKKNLTINTEKTKIVIFKKRINKRLYKTFKLNGNPIEIVDEFKYLGVKLYRTGNWQFEMDARATASNFAFNKLKGIIVGQKGANFTTKTALVSSMVESVLLYGSEIWGVEDTSKILKSQLKYYKTLLYLPSNTPDYAVTFESGIESIDSLIIRRCLRWWIKIINAPESSYIKLCYNKLMQSSSSTDNWVLKLRRKLFPMELDYIWESQEMRTNDFLWHQTLNFHKQQIRSSILSRINSSTSLYWYRFLINPETNSNFLKLNLPINVTNTICQIRLLNKFNEKIYVNGSSHKFYNNQNCTICNYQEKDTLQHLLTSCNITNSIRKDYLTTSNPEIELLAMLKSDNKEDILKIVSFVKQSLRIRSFILFE